MSQIGIDLAVAVTAISTRIDAVVLAIQSAAAELQVGLDGDDKTAMQNAITKLNTEAASLQAAQAELPPVSASPPASTAPVDTGTPGA